MILKTLTIMAVSGVFALGGDFSDALCFCSNPYGVTASAGGIAPMPVTARYGYQKGGRITDEESFLNLLGRSSWSDLTQVPTPAVYSTLSKPDPEEVKKIDAPKRSLRSEHKLDAPTASEFKASKRGALRWKNPKTRKQGARINRNRRGRK